MIIDEINKFAKFYIYGAQVVAYGAFCAIRHLTGRMPENFLVSQRAHNPTEIKNIAVTTPDNADKSAPVLVAVTELLQGEIKTILRAQGFRHIFLLTAREEYRLMSAYFAGLGKFLPVMAKGAAENDFVLYEVCNHRDKRLSNRAALRPFERTIQAGAALTDRRIAGIADNVGDNISRKNRAYCEMTAVYWVWRNTSHRWTGIEHYRRHLLVEPAMLTEEVDAILPLPYIAYPDTLTQFGRFVPPSVVQALLQTLQALEPTRYDGYLSILRGKYQYTYNMMCVRREVFDDYCRWFFRLTEHMEKMADQVPEFADTRALSYVAEVLTNIYFMSRQNDINIRHVAKEIYV